jgi:hypothetical protein
MNKKTFIFLLVGILLNMRAENRNYPVSDLVDISELEFPFYTIGGMSKDQQKCFHKYGSPICPEIINLEQIKN